MSYLIIGPFAGMAVDRFPIRTVLVLSNPGRAVVTLGLFLAPDWPTLMLLVALRSGADTSSTPAK